MENLLNVRCPLACLKWNSFSLYNYSFVLGDSTHSHSRMNDTIRSFDTIYANSDHYSIFSLSIIIILLVEEYETRV